MGLKMAICTLCGTLHHDGDKHICNSSDLPEKGKEKKYGNITFTDVTEK
jgi:hypothetical protein